jgi:hypothetical protein
MLYDGFVVQNEGINEWKTHEDGIPWENENKSIYGCENTTLFKIGKTGNEKFANIKNYTAPRLMETYRGQEGLILMLLILLVHNSSFIRINNFRLS